MYTMSEALEVHRKKTFFYLTFQFKIVDEFQRSRPA
jgi:hypothetical protein